LPTDGVGFTVPIATEAPAVRDPTPPRQEISAAIGHDEALSESDLTFTKGYPQRRAAQLAAGLISQGLSLQLAAAFEAGRMTFSGCTSGRARAPLDPRQRAGRTFASTGPCMVATPSPSRGQRGCRRTCLNSLVERCCFVRRPSEIRRAQNREKSLGVNGRSGRI
jgi:hypothetical protein